MVEVPAVLFYAATVAMAVVCAFIVVLLFYLIKAARAALTIAEFVEEEGRRVAGAAKRVRRVFALASELFYE